MPFFIPKMDLRNISRDRARYSSMNIIVYHCVDWKIMFCYLSSVYLTITFSFCDTIRFAIDITIHSYPEIFIHFHKNATTYTILYPFNNLSMYWILGLTK